MGWIEEKEAFFNNDDLGDSVAAVEALIIRHDGFVMTLEKQAIIIDELEKKGDDMVSKNHSNADVIRDMLNSVRAQMDFVREKCILRSKSCCLVWCCNEVFLVFVFIYRL